MQERLNPNCFKLCLLKLNLHKLHLLKQHLLKRYLHMLNCPKLPLSAYAASGAPSKACKTTRSEGISKDPWGALICPGRFLERIPGGARSFQMVSKDRWGPPGSSLNHLVALWRLHWEAECGQRYPWKCVEKLMFSNMLSTQVTLGARGSLLTPPSRFIMYTSGTPPSCCFI